MHPSEALSPRDIYGARVTASVLDLLLIGISAGPLPGASGWVFALGFSFVYLGVLQGITGWSLSKAMLGVRVVKVGTTDHANPVATAVRWLLAPLGIPVLTAISSAFNDRRRGVGDLVARTEVVGMAPATRWRTYAVIGYIALLSIFIAASSINTFLILAAIFGPMAIAGLVIVLGSRRMPGGTVWLVGLGFTFIGAALMSFQGLCKRGGGNCVDLSVAHKAIPAFIICIVAMVIVFTLRGTFAYVAVALLTAVAEIWMFTRLRKGEEMAFAAVLVLIFLVGALAGEVVRYMRRRAEERDAAAQAAVRAATPG
jgi:hypothetical protein